MSMIPVMTKADVMANWDDVVTDRRLTLEQAEAHLAHVASDGPAYLLGDYQVLTTGGSSGTRGVFVWDFEGFLMYALGRDRGTLWLQQRDGRTESRRAIVASAHATHATSVLARTFAGSPQLGATRSFPVTLPLEQIVEGLNAFEPTDLMSYTSMLQRLGEEQAQRTAADLARFGHVRRRATDGRSPRRHRGCVRVSAQQPLRGDRGRDHRSLLSRIARAPPQRGHRRLRARRRRQPSGGPRHPGPQAARHQRHQPRAAAHPLRAHRRDHRARRAEPRPVDRTPHRRHRRPQRRRLRLRPCRGAPVRVPLGDRPSPRGARVSRCARPRPAPTSRCERRPRSTPTRSPASSWTVSRRSASTRRTCECRSSRPSPDRATPGRSGRSCPSPAGRRGSSRRTSVVGNVSPEPCSPWRETSRRRSRRSSRMSTRSCAASKIRSGWPCAACSRRATC